MSREDNKLPPIGPKPGQEEPWGYDRKINFQEITPEELMSGKEALAQLEQRFHVKKGVMIARVDPDNPEGNKEYVVTGLTEITVNFCDMRSGEALFIPIWAALHRFNHGIWKVIKQSEVKE